MTVTFQASEVRMKRAQAKSLRPTVTKVDRNAAKTPQSELREGEMVWQVNPRTPDLGAKS